MIGFYESEPEGLTARHRLAAQLCILAGAPAGGSASAQGCVWNAVPSVPQLIMDGAHAFIYAAGQTPSEQVGLTAGSITYLVADSLGSMCGTVNGSGALTGTTSYDAWGNPQTTGGLTASTPFGYAGSYTDATGLIYLVNRYYSPAIGQFSSVDPDLSKSLSPYGYGSEDPIANVDPNRLSTKGCFFTTVAPFFISTTSNKIYAQER